MTAKLSDWAGQTVGVRVLRQEAGVLYPDEKHLLRHTASHGHVREVCLESAKGPVLVARTVMLSKVLRALPKVQSLGAQPLGELLFASGQTARWSAREWAQITPVSPLFRLVRQCAQPYRFWARRTLYELDGQPLLVTEVFLPPLLRQHAFP